MGEMMATTGGPVLLWALLAVALAVVVGGGVAVRVGDPPAVRQAKDTLRLRYANGEISREEYLHGKVELEG